MSQLSVPHPNALDALVVGITSRKVNYILDADIRSFFDSVDQTWLVRFIKHRISDRRVIRLIQKWLRAGVLEDGVVTVRNVSTILRQPSVEFKLGCLAFSAVD